MANEADTCRKYILKNLYSATWTDDQIQEQKTFTDGRIVVIGSKVQRRPQKRADYILRYRRDFPIAVVEAKASYKTAGDAVQQAKEYAQILGLQFAYATNGGDIIEIDFTTGAETIVAGFPSPEELWARLRASQNISDDIAQRVLSPSYHIAGKSMRYYQEIAINRTVQAILQGKPRVLLTMATGTGKTVIAFQICWKLWSSRWNRTGEYRRPKILYLADRNILVDDPKDKTFTPFGDARHKIGDGPDEPVKSREMYFATYQAIARDEHRPGLYREFPPDFFDFIVIDECHRGSARDDSNWREILDYFRPAFQLGMTATPLRNDNQNTYSYFDKPIYTYSLRQGIDDGFLAPYRVHRIISTWDAVGWRPSKDELDRYGQEVPDGLYETKDFERIVALRARTEAFAHHLAEFMKKTDRFAKTVIFCVTQEHADEMRRALTNLNADLVKLYPNYICRVVADEGAIGRGHLDDFTDVETLTPVILTTSQLLTTGVDMQTCKNIVLARVVGSMTEFKQIIGRGTRVRDDYGKLYFNILDYTGSATRLFVDPDFDGDPSISIEETLDENGEIVEPPVVIDEEETDDDSEEVIIDGPDKNGGTIIDCIDDKPRRFYIDGGYVEIAAHLVYELDPDGKQLRVVKFTDYTAESVRTLYPTAADLRSRWIDPVQRAEIITALEERGISFDELATATNQPDADSFDLLCHVAFNAPLRTRRERADRLRKEKTNFFDDYGPTARAILDELLEKYAEFGCAQFELPSVLQVPPISEHGNLMEIAMQFGGPGNLREAINMLQTLLYLM